MGQLMDMFERERAERMRRRNLGLPLEPADFIERNRRRKLGAALVPVERVHAHTHIERPGIDNSIPESERREYSREPGEEG